MSVREPITYRRALREDWPAIRALLQACSLPLDGAEDHLETFLVAKIDQRLVACAGIEPYGAAALLRSCAVDADYRRHGLGHELVQRAVALAASLKIRELVLLTTAAENYFPRFGFQPIRRHEVADSLQASHEFRGACPASACVMRLEITA